MAVLSFTPTRKHLPRVSLLKLPPDSFVDIVPKILISFKRCISGLTVTVATEIWVFSDAPCSSYGMNTGTGWGVVNGENALWKPWAVCEANRRQGGTLVWSEGRAWAAPSLRWGMSPAPARDFCSPGRMPWVPCFWACLCPENLWAQTPWWLLTSLLGREITLNCPSFW